MKKRSNIDFMTILKNPRVICGAILFVFVTVMFAVSVNMRSEYKDYVAKDHHHHLTATSVAFANNWLDDGMINDHFAMIINPKSVEFKTLHDRSFYDSYPSGCIAPLYVLARVTGTKEITFGFVQRWNLFIQYMTTLLLAFMVYLIALKLSKHPAYMVGGLIAAVIPAAINLFMPAPFYFFHSVYFADQAVLLPFMLTIFLELLRVYFKEGKPLRVLSIVQAVVIFTGIITDYLFICLVAVLYVKRLLLGEISFKPIKKWLLDSVKFAAPAILGLGLFALQILINGPVRILDMFMFRTGLNDESGWTGIFEQVFWKDYITRGYGANADMVLKVSLGIVLLAVITFIVIKLVKGYKNERIKLILSMAALVIVPCFMQVYLLKNHSAIHDFSCLKFSLVFSVVPFVLLPAMAVELLRPAFVEKCRDYVFGTVMVIFAVICCVNTNTTHNANAKGYFPEAYPEYQTVGGFLQENTDYNDVVFSFDYIIYDANDYPQGIALSKKRVYRIDSIRQIYDKVKDIEDDYTINIFSYGRESDKTDAKKLKSAAAQNVITQNNMTLYKIGKDDFLKMVD